MRAIGSSVAAACLAAASNADDRGSRTGLGIVCYCRSLWRAARVKADPGVDPFEPFAFLAHCSELGAGGIQAALGVLDDARAAALQQQAQEQGMFVEAIISLPQDDGDADRFRVEMRTASRAGARAVRCVAIPGRRYEYFQSLEDFRRAEADALQMLLRAAPIAEELRLPLAVENHKDQRIDERLKLFEAVDSEFVGACVDTGNSLALLEDPLDTVGALAPWAKAVHLKDQALQVRDDGFLLADVPLGAGVIDLREVVRLLRERQPGLPMCLEFITRDPLVVPCLSEDYWRPMGDWPARDLARTLRLAKERGAAELTFVSRLPPEAQVTLETRNIRTSLDYAREVLSL